MKSVYRNIALWLIVLIHAFSVRAQTEMPCISLRAAAMGATTAALSDDMSALSNIAALAWRNAPIVAIAYRQDYALAGLAHQWIGGALPLSSTGSLRASYHHYGSSTYSEQYVSAGYAQRLASGVVAGVALNYYYSSSSDAHYDAQHALSFTTSAQASLGQRWRIGVILANAANTIGGNANLPLSVETAIAFRAASDWTTTLGYHYHAGYSSVHAGAEYRFAHHMAARLGVATNPLVCSFGAGYNATHLCIDLAVEYHQLLGLTPMVGGAWRF